jgi:diguanylate cyclase (GGDEF)-like protein
MAKSHLFDVGKNGIIPFNCVDKIYECGDCHVIGVYIMKKYFVGSLLFVMLIVIPLAAFLQYTSEKAVNTRMPDETAEVWSLSFDKVEDYYETSVELPSGTLSGRYVSMQSTHYGLEMYIGDELVYSLHTNGRGINRSTGYRWVFVALSDEDAGKTLTIRCIPAHWDVTPKTSLYYGSRSAISRMLFSGYGLRFAISLFILVAGFFLMLYGFFISGNKAVDSDIFPFSLFAMLFACWSITESPICDMLTKWPVFDMVVDNYALMLMPTAFCMFTRKVFTSRHPRWWVRYLYFNNGITVLRTLLCVTSLMDIKSTLWMTQLSIVVFVVIGIYYGIGEIKNAANTTRYLKLNCICISLVLLSTFIELLCFRIIHHSTVMGMVAGLIYMIVISFETIMGARQQMQQAQAAELYKKLAYTDELTGIYNRMAFRNDLEVKKTDAAQDGDGDDTAGDEAVSQRNDTNVIFMMDLNDLKLCNDNYGHEYGDRYIKMVSDAIAKVFENSGRCYRIGGDEFCATMQSASVGAARQRFMELNKSFEKLNEQEFVVPVKVAVGYAVFDPKVDKSLNDTMKRADDLMYENKALLKGR